MTVRRKLATLVVALGVFFGVALALPSSAWAAFYSLSGTFDIPCRITSTNATFGTARIRWQWYTNDSNQRRLVNVWWGYNASPYFYYAHVSESVNGSPLGTEYAWDGGPTQYRSQTLPTGGRQFTSTEMPYISTSTVADMNFSAYGTDSDPLGRTYHCWGSHNF